MTIPIKRSKHLLVAGLLAVMVGCGSSSSNPDAGGGGHAAGGGAGHASGGAAGHAAGGGGGTAAGTGGAGGRGGAAGGGGGSGGGPATGGGGAAGSPGASGGMAGTAGAGGSAGPIEFTDFVNNLIKNETAPNTTPQSINDKTFKDSMNPAAFSALFP